MPRKNRRIGTTDLPDTKLVVELIELIRLLAEFSELNMLFDDLALLERHEKGKRREAIRFIRNNVSPRTLGLRISPPEPKGPNHGQLLADALKKFKPAPPCLRRQRLHRQQWITTSRPAWRPNAEEFLRKEHRSQIISRWLSLNDPNPPRAAYAA